MRRKLIAFALPSLFFLLLTNPVFSQNNFSQTQIDSIIKKRWDFRSIRTNYPKSQFEIIEIIKRCCPNEVDSMAEIATKKIEDEDYRSPIFLFELVLEKRPGNLSAHYGIGVCKRELGRASFIERIGFWPSSENHFKQVLKIDSTYEDVFYQYSLLESYRENDKEAIQLIDKQLEIDQSNDKFQQKRVQLYDKLLHQKSIEEVREWFESGKTVKDIYYLGELYRINGLFKKADSIYQKILLEDEDFSVVQIYLSLVRLYVQTEQFEKAEESYWKAVESVSNDFEENVLIEDFIYIVKENEYNLLKKGLPFYLLPDLYRTFWLTRNPMPAAPYNFRLIEHYNRLIYAEKHYRYEGLRNNAYYNELHIGLPVWYYENYKFSDVGLIFIRFGTPDEQALTASQNMSWLYYEGGDRLRRIFHFWVPIILVRQAEIHAPLGHWVLIPAVTDPDIDQEIAHWGFEHVDERKTDVHHAFQNDFHSWPKGTKDLGMVYSTAHFQKNRDEDIVQISYALPLSNIIDEKTVKDSGSLETGIAVFDDKMILLFKETRYYNLSEKNDPSVWHNLFIDEFEFPLQLSSFNIALHARILEKNKIGGHRYRYTLSDASRDQLFCSSLKLAFDISSKSDLTDRHRDQLKIIPNPTKKFKKDKPLFAYFEIYNLTKNPAGKTEYSLHFELTQVKNKKNVFNKVLGLFGGQEKYQVSIKNDYEGESQTVSDYMNFDINRLDKGEYELRMIVIDNVSEKETLTVADFILN